MPDSLARFTRHRLCLAESACEHLFSNAIFFLIWLAWWDVVLQTTCCRLHCSNVQAHQFLPRDGFPQTLGAQLQLVRSRTNRGAHHGGCRAGWSRRMRPSLWTSAPLHQCTAASSCHTRTRNCARVLVYFAILSCWSSHMAMVAPTWQWWLLIAVDVARRCGTLLTAVHVPHTLFQLSHMPDDTWKCYSAHGKVAASKVRQRIATARCTTLDPTCGAPLGL